MASLATGIPWKTHISAGNEPLHIDSRNSTRPDSIRFDSIRFDSARKNADSTGLRVDRQRAGRAEGRGVIARNICGIGCD